MERAHNHWHLPELKVWQQNWLSLENRCDKKIFCAANWRERDRQTSQTWQSCSAFVQDRANESKMSSPQYISNLFAISQRPSCSCVTAFCLNGCCLWVKAGHPLSRANDLVRRGHGWCNWTHDELWLRVQHRLASTVWEAGHVAILWRDLKSRLIWKFKAAVINIFLHNQWISWKWSLVVLGLFTQLHSFPLAGTLASFSLCFQCSASL